MPSFRKNSHKQQEKKSLINCKKHDQPRRPQAPKRIRDIIANVIKNTPQRAHKTKKKKKDARSALTVMKINHRTQDKNGSNYRPITKKIKFNFG